MELIRYFAYGSNMLTKRLQDRCRSARKCGIAQAEGVTVSFNKRSVDGSGKATLGASEVPGACVHGILFEIVERELEDLDRFEGLGMGYNRDDTFQVVNDSDRLPQTVTTYVADPKWIDLNLKPYDWYLRLVVSGARQHQLPKPYIDALAATPSIVDEKPDRKSRVDAIGLLAQVSQT